MLQGGVIIGIVTLVLGVAEMEFTFDDKTAWKVCVGLEYWMFLVNHSI